MKADRGEHASEGPAPGDREIAGMLETSSASACQHVAGFAFGDLSAFELFVGVLRDPSFREVL